MRRCPLCGCCSCCGCCPWCGRCGRTLCCAGPGRAVASLPCSPVPCRLTANDTAPDEVQFAARCGQASPLPCPLCIVRSCWGAGPACAACLGWQGAMATVLHAAAASFLSCGRRPSRCPQRGCGGPWLDPAGPRVALQWWVWPGLWLACQVSAGHEARRMADRAAQRSPCQGASDG